MSELTPMTPMTPLGGLKPMTPLGGAEPREDVIGAFHIVEKVDAALASLAARNGCQDEISAAIEAALGLRLPEPGLSAETGDYRAWWAAPGQWMVEADYARHALLAQELKQIVGAAGSVSEQTDGWCRFDVSGPGPEALFERLCAVDMPRMAIGAATRTSLHHIGCFLIRSADGVNVIAPRSSAGSLHHALIEVARAVS